MRNQGRGKIALVESSQKKELARGVNFFGIFFGAVAWTPQAFTIVMLVIGWCGSSGAPGQYYIDGVYSI